MIKQNSLFKMRSIKLQLFPTRVLNKRIQRKDPLSKKKSSLKNFIISKQGNIEATKVAPDFDHFINNTNRYGYRLKRAKKELKAELKKIKKYKNPNKRTKTLRELTVYNYHYKKIYRKHKYSLHPKLKPFWLKLIDNSQYYNNGKLLPLAAAKLYNLSRNNLSDRKRITNFDKKNHKIYLNKYNAIKLKLNNKLKESRVVHINLYFNPTLENKLPCYQ